MKNINTYICSIDYLTKNPQYKYEGFNGVIISFKSWKNYITTVIIQTLK